MNKPSRCINLPKLMIPTPYSHRESRDFGQRADGRLSSFLLPPALATLLGGLLSRQIRPREVSWTACSANSLVSSAPPLERGASR